MHVVYSWAVKYSAVVMSMIDPWAVKYSTVVMHAIDSYSLWQLTLNCGHACDRLIDSSA